MHHVVNAPDTSKLFALKWWILCDVNFTKNFFLMLGKGVKEGDRKASQGTTDTRQPERRPHPAHTPSVWEEAFSRPSKKVFIVSPSVHQGWVSGPGGSTSQEIYWGKWM